MERRARDGGGRCPFCGPDAPPVTAFWMVCRDPSPKPTAAGGRFAGDVSGAFPCRDAAPPFDPKIHALSAKTPTRVFGGAARRKRIKDAASAAAEAMVWGISVPASC
ncbi:hypothetical protein TcCL_NonESM07311, partial [Trypanosoma cruzi]